MKNFATVFSAELEGVHARTIEVEVDLNIGLHAFNIVGLADRALTEARERVNSALKNSGLKPPNRENRKITVNLAPADVRKTGSQYDLAIALGYLAATTQISAFDARDKLFIGELALDGRLRPVAGALSIAEMAAAKKFNFLFVPRANANEAAAIPNVRVVALDRLTDAVRMLARKASPPRYIAKEESATPTTHVDLAEVRGQESAKRALLIAASGGHHVLLSGPPGTGKSTLAQALATMLPELTPAESIEVTKVWSAAGVRLRNVIRTRPFRAPHQTSSLHAIVGGGPDLRPGEISLAHCGVLFLDELPEFPKNILEALRVPLESGAIRVARTKGSVTFPARFSLVAAMNPCGCGFHGDSGGKCECTPYEVMQYQRRLSGPFLDRIDMTAYVPRVPIAELRSQKKKDAGGMLTTKLAKGIVQGARERQAQRFKGERAGLRTNADMTSGETERSVSLSGEAVLFLDGLQDHGLSPRGYYRLLKTARTIADIEGHENVNASDLAEAWSYRVRGETGG